MEYIAIVAAVIIVVLLQTSKSAKRKAAPQKKAAGQLDIVAKSDFHKRKLMNKQEYALFKQLEKTLKAGRPDLMVFPQVSFGEIIGSDNKVAYLCINSKRADFVIISCYGDPVAVIEYQGAAHYQGNAIERDAVKKEACRKAGIAYLEITPGYHPDDLTTLIARLPALNA